MSIIGWLGADTCRIVHCVFPLLEWIGFTVSGAAVPVLGLGDLGGWALDLLQIRGSYLANAPEEDLASWLHTHLGEQDARMGFGYSDVLADCDAWLLARSMQSNSSERSLSTAMRDAFAHYLRFEQACSFIYAL